MAEMPWNIILPRVPAVGRYGRRARGENVRWAAPGGFAAADLLCVTFRAKLWHLPDPGPRKQGN